MANEIFINGSEAGNVSIWDETALAYRPVACLTSASLASTLSVIETETKCNPGVIVKDPNQFSYDISVDGVYLDTTSAGGDTAKASHDYLYELQSSKSKFTFKLDTGLADTTYYGTAFISDLNADFSNGENATFSATLSGDGSTTKTDPNV